MLVFDSTVGRHRWHHLLLLLMADQSIHSGSGQDNQSAAAVKLTVPVLWGAWNSDFYDRYGSSEFHPSILKTGDILIFKEVRRVLGIKTGSTPVGIGMVVQFPNTDWQQKFGYVLEYAVNERQTTGKLLDHITYRNVCDGIRMVSLDERLYIASSTLKHEVEVRCPLVQYDADDRQKNRDGIPNPYRRSFITSTSWNTGFEMRCIKLQRAVIAPALRTALAKVEDASFRPVKFVLYCLKELGILPTQFEITPFTTIDSLVPPPKELQVWDDQCPLSMALSKLGSPTSISRPIQLSRQHIDTVLQYH